MLRNFNCKKIKHPKSEMNIEPSPSIRAKRFLLDLTGDDDCVLHSVPDQEIACCDSQDKNTTQAGIPSKECLVVGEAQSVLNRYLIDLSSDHSDPELLPINENKSNTPEMSNIRPKSKDKKRLQQKLKSARTIRNDNNISTNLNEQFVDDLGPVNNININTAESSNLRTKTINKRRLQKKLNSARTTKNNKNTSKELLNKNGVDNVVRGKALDECNLGNQVNTQINYLEKFIGLKDYFNHSKSSAFITGMWKWNYDRYFDNLQNAEAFLKKECWVTESWYCSQLITKIKYQCLQITCPAAVYLYMTTRMDKVMLYRSANEHNHLHCSIKLHEA